MAAIPTRSTFQDALRSGRPLLFDGSVSTVLYERGVFINRSFDEANLQSPDLVRSIHQDFAAAGAQVLSTNTWGANAVKLAAYGLELKLREINLAGARLAREASEEAWIAGTIGPLGVRIEPWGPTSFEEAREAFRHLEAGAHLGKVVIRCGS